MAKYDITHSCGHIVTHNLAGPERARPARRAWLADRPCLECRRAAEQAAAQAATADLPALTGSPAQVAWAERIRAEARTQIDELVARVGKPLSVAEQQAIDNLLGRAAAAWWIDNRSDTGGAAHWLRLAARTAA